MPSLIVQIPGGGASEHILDPRKRCTIGSHARCAVRIDAPGIPPLCCQIQHAGGRWVLRHVQGSEAPHVNGRARKTAFLEHGDAIFVGPARFLFRGGGEGLVSAQALVRPARAPRSPARRAAGTRAARRTRTAGGPAVIFIACGILVALVVGAFSLRCGGGGREGPQPLEAAIRERATFEVPAGTFAISASGAAELRVDLGERRPFSVAKGDACAVELADGRGRPAGRYRLLSLPDEVLLRILALGSEAPEARGGLALLLLHAEGPRRAAGFLGKETGGGGASGSDGAAKPAYPGEVEPRRWADRKARLLARERGRLAAARASSPLDWAALAAGALSAWFDARGFGAEDASREIREIFLAARSESLPAPPIFSRAAKAEAAKDMRTRIVYRYAAEKAALRAALDLRAVGAATKPPRYENGALVLAGEYRLLSGDPFAGEVTLRLKARVLDPAAPNANVAIWARDDDVLTLPEGEEPNWFEMLRREAGTPSDYFLFGYGYRRVTGQALEEKLEEVVRAADGESVKLPALVVLAGHRGSLLRLDRGECLFAEPIAGAAIRRDEFSIDWKRGSVVWTAGTRTLPRATNAGTRACTRSRDPRQGPGAQEPVRVYAAAGWARSPAMRRSRSTPDRPRGRDARCRFFEARRVEGAARARPRPARPSRRPERPPRCGLAPIPESTSETA